MTTNQIPQSAIDQGFTRHLLVTTATDELTGYVKADADIDQLFELYDEDNHEIYRVRGWLATVEPLDADDPLHEEIAEAHAQAHAEAMAYERREG